MKKIGFSFIAQNKDESIFMFAAQELCHYKFTCTNEHEFRSNIRDMKQAELLQQTFFETEFGSPFVNSGFHPQKLVCVNVWVSFI